MQHTVLLLRLAFFGSLLALVQDTFAQDHCWIKYSYDPAGNRIKREWWCGIPKEPDPGSEVKSKESQDFGFRVMPVPAADQLTFTSERSLANATLEVVNLQGRTVIKQGANGTRTVVDVSALAPGVYVLRVRDEGSEYSTEFNVLR